MGGHRGFIFELDIFDEADFNLYATQARDLMRTMGGEITMNSTRVIPVEGVTELPDFAAEAVSADELRERRERNELRLLKVATGLSIVLVSCAWVFLALD